MLALKMRSATFYPIYILVGFVVWLLLGSLILFVSISGFYQFFQDLTVGQKAIYVVYFILLGSLTALIQAMLMAKGGRERSSWLMAGAPLVLGVVVGGLLAILGPQVLESQLGLINATSNIVIRLVLGVILGAIAIFATTALAAYLRSQLGMRGPL